MVTLINPPSRLHYLRNLRSPALLGCDACTAAKLQGIVPPYSRRSNRPQLGDDTNFLAAGTVLSYTAQWGNNFSSWNDPNGIQSGVQGKLAAQWGIIVQNQFHSTSDIINFSGKSGFTLTVQTNRDYGNANDVKSIIDGELVNFGVMGLISSIAITKNVQPAGAVGVATGTTSGALAAAQAGYNDAVARGDMESAAAWAAQIRQFGGSAPGGNSFTDWLTNNWPWLAAGVGGFVLLRRVL